MAKEIISPETLRELLCYEPDTGKLYWKERHQKFFNGTRGWKSWNTRFARKEAFTSLTSKGYRQGGIFGEMYSAHRVIWAMIYGAWPAEFVDHINGNRADNRICNLRKASHIENLWNQRKQRNNTSGYKGVSFHIRKGKWVAQIQTRSGQKYLGLFDTPGAAHDAYGSAAKRYHGQFANYG